MKAHQAAHSLATMCRLLDVSPSGYEAWRRRAPSRRARRDAVLQACFDFIEGFYNPQRRHSALGYLSPLAFERLEGT